MGRLFIIGAGGHGCVLAELAQRTGSWASIALLDDQREQPALEIGIDVSGTTSEIESLVRPGDGFLIAVGDNRRRIELLHSLRSTCSPATLLDPAAHVSPSSTIGAGSVVMPGAIVQTGAVVGAGCILNSGCVVEHGVRLSDGVHVAPGACIGGDVQIGACSWIGIGASVVHGCTITDDVVVGAGGAVVESLVKPGTYAGVPARMLGTGQ